jgi:hypothetical protein
MDIRNNNIIEIKNNTGVSIYAHLDGTKPPCGVGKYGACNPPDVNGDCGSREYPVTGSRDITYDASDCGIETGDDSKWAKGEIEDLWAGLDGPYKSGVKFYVKKTDGTYTGGNQEDIKPVQLLEPGETWVILPPVSSDTGKAQWCFKFDRGGNKMVCSGSGGSFTPEFSIADADGNRYKTNNINAPVGINRFEFNVNSTPTWKNWVLNTSAVDGINSIMTAHIDSSECNGDKKIDFKCGIDLANCPCPNQGAPYLSVDGKNVRYPSCIAPKNFGLPVGEPLLFNETSQICEPKSDDCWAGANGALPDDKIRYHQAWDMKSDNIEPEAKTWQDFIRPGPPGSSDICDTYTWAYDEQVCDTNSYSGQGQCYAEDGTLMALDNPYAPLGTCLVYDNDDKYVNPKIYISVDDILSEQY